MLTLLKLRTPSIFITTQSQILGKQVCVARANRNTLEEGKKEVSARIFCKSEHKLHVAAIIAEPVMKRYIEFSANKTDYLFKGMIL